MGACSLSLKHSFTPFNWDPYNGTLRCEIGPGPAFSNLSNDHTCRGVCVSAAYLTVQLLHRHQVQGLEGMSGRGDEIEADVDPGVVVVKQRALNLQLLLEVVLKLGVDVVHNGLVAVDTGTEKG